MVPSPVHRPSIYVTSFDQFFQVYHSYCLSQETNLLGRLCAQGYSSSNTQ